MLIQLPIITFKGISYFFDYRLHEIRNMKTACSIFLNDTELELLNYAIQKKDPVLIKINMDSLKYKL